MSQKLSDQFGLYWKLASCNRQFRRRSKHSGACTNKSHYLWLPPFNEPTATTSLLVVKPTARVLCSCEMFSEP